jgi:hypothetical protein
MFQDSQLVVVIWLVCAVAATVIGGRKGNPFGALFLGVVLGPLGLIAAILSGHANSRPCMHCAELILKKAKVCPHCRHDVAG